MTSNSRLQSCSFVVAVCFVAVLILCGSVSAQQIKVSSKLVGETPRIVGLNCGNYQPDSNTRTWWKWLGANGVRIFTSATRLEPDDDIAPHGDGVSDQASFVARRKALRADPENPQFINFELFAKGYAKAAGHINYALAYGELSEMGIEPLAMSARTNERYPIKDWADRWEHWQHHYAQAYYLGKNYGVSRYSIYNEPDHKDQTITQADFLSRLQLASDAIQSAIADVNRDTKQKLRCQIMAPVTAGSAKDYRPRLKNSDTRDDRFGWGELVIKNLHTDFLGRQQRGFQLIHTYAYQQYNGSGAEFGADLANIKRMVAADLAQLRWPGRIDFGLTEFNVHSNGEFGKRSDDLDTPSRYATLGGILAGLANQQPQELYLFKFSSNARDQERMPFCTTAVLTRPTTLAARHERRAFSSCLPRRLRVSWDCISSPATRAMNCSSSRLTIGETVVTICFRPTKVKRLGTFRWIFQHGEFAAVRLLKSKKSAKAIWPKSHSDSRSMAAPSRFANRGKVPCCFRCRG